MMDLIGPQDSFYFETVVRCHALLHLSSRVRNHFLSRTYQTIYIVKVKQLLECADYFRDFPQLGSLVEVLHIELVPDVMDCILPFSEVFAARMNDIDQARRVKKPTGKDLAFIDRRRIIVPSNDYALWSQTPCWHDVEKSKRRKCDHCQRIGELHIIERERIVIPRREWIIADRRLRS